MADGEGSFVGTVEEVTVIQSSGGESMVDGPRGVSVRVDIEGWVAEEQEWDDAVEASENHLGWDHEEVFISSDDTIPHPEVKPAKQPERDRPSPQSTVLAAVAEIAREIGTVPDMRD